MQFEDDSTRLSEAEPLVEKSLLGWREDTKWARVERYDIFYSCKFFVFFGITQVVNKLTALCSTNMDTSKRREGPSQMNWFCLKDLIQISSLWMMLKSRMDTDRHEYRLGLTDYVQEGFEMIFLKMILDMPALRESTLNKHEPVLPHLVCCSSTSSVSFTVMSIISNE